MAVFISHSFSDKDQFDNIADALENVAIPYWKPGEMLPGANLSEQLRQAISRSELCVFVATTQSVNSAWCGAELGAFWGSGKRVMIYIADSSLKEDQLPQQFKGHFLERRIKKLVSAVQHYLQKESNLSSSERGNEAQPPQGLSRQELIGLLEEALDRSETRYVSAAAMRQLSESFAASAPAELSDTVQRAVRYSLYSLLGLPQRAIEDVAAADWSYHVKPFVTTTGQWSGYARNFEYVNYQGPYQDRLFPCLLLRLDERKRVAAAAILPYVIELEHDRATILTTPIAVAGRGQVGEFQGYLSTGAT